VFMRPDIILIGPFGAGKSTLAKHLVRRLGWSCRSLDEGYYRYLRQIEGFNDEIENQIYTWELTSPQRQPYNAYAVERFLLEHSNPDERYVLEFGAGHSVYEDREHLNRVKQILAPYPNLVLILPSPDHEESVQILLDQIRQHRLKGRNMSDERICNINRYIVEHHSNYELAKITVYTKGRSPKETSEEICHRIGLQV